MLSACLLFLLASFCKIFLDIARYACEKSYKNPLNIKQKSRPNANNPIWDYPKRMAQKIGGQYPCRILPANNADAEVRKMCSLNYSANIYLTCTTRYLLVLQNICGFVMRSTYWSLESRSSL